MSDKNDIMSSRPLTLAHIIALSGFLILCTFYVTRIYDEFEAAKNERETMKERTEYVNDRLTTITKRNADKIKEVKNETK